MTHSAGFHVFLTFLYPLLVQRASGSCDKGTIQTILDCHPPSMTRDKQFPMDLDGIPKIATAAGTSPESYCRDYITWRGCSKDAMVTCYKDHQIPEQQVSIIKFLDGVCQDASATRLLPCLAEQYGACSPFDQGHHGNHRYLRCVGGGKPRLDFLSCMRGGCMRRQRRNSEVLGRLLDAVDCEE